MHTNALPPATQRDIKTVIEKTAGTNLAVYLFGSQARQTARFGSDIDIAIERTDGKPLAPGVLSALKDAFDDSRLVERVDVIDLNRASLSFKNAIKKDAVAL
jgi:predicted nucleotidyltransferase